MLRSRAFLLIAAFGTALSFGACDCNGSASRGDPLADGGTDGGPLADGGGGPPSDGGTDGGGPSCVAEGAACVSGRPCCTGSCDGTVCSSTPFCKVNGDSCSNGTECCLNNCNNGTCSDKVCSDVGTPCSAPGDCCTGTCTAGQCASLPGGSCKVLGQACANGSDCCSTNCQGGACAKAYYCQATSDICRANDECCGHVCSANNDGGVGRCIAVTGGGGGGCIQEGNPCSDGSNCCSRICFDPGSGATVCLPAEGCRLTGTWCPDTQSCCGGGTNPNGSVTCNDGRCDHGNACNPVGNICGANVLPDGGHINAPQDCCDNAPTGPGKDVCKLDSSGIPRCFGGGSAQCPTGYTGDAGCCIAAGQQCQFKDQCCGGAPCVPGADGGLVCTVNSCTSVGSTCTTTSECCAGTECRATSEVNKACQPIVKPDAGAPDAGLCQSNGTACTSAGQCCSQRCIGGTCLAPGACQPQGAVCTTTADCCSGYSCSVPAGATSGTCQASACAGGGQPCVMDSNCCNGLVCLDPNSYSCTGTTDCTCKTLLQ